MKKIILGMLVVLLSLNLSAKNILTQDILTQNEKDWIASHVVKVAVESHPNPLKTKFQELSDRII